MLAWSSLTAAMRGPILCPVPAPAFPSTSLRQVAQFIFLYLKQDFGSQGWEASLRSAGWAPSCCHGIVLLSKALLHWASFSTAFCCSFGAHGGSARAAKAPLTSSASVDGSNGHPAWELLFQTEARPIIPSSCGVAPMRRTHLLLPSAYAERHNPIFKASFLGSPRLLFSTVSITWLPCSPWVKSYG